MDGNKDRTWVEQLSLTLPENLLVCLMCFETWGAFKTTVGLDDCTWKVTLLPLPHPTSRSSGFTIETTPKNMIWQFRARVKLVNIFP